MSVVPRGEEMYRVLHPLCKLRDVHPEMDKERIPLLSPPPQDSLLLSNYCVVQEQMEEEIKDKEVKVWMLLI